MGITDEQDKSGKVKPPLLPKPCTSSSAGSGEHVIPQMIITSADDISSEIQNTSEAASAPTSPSSESSVCDIQVEGEVTKVTEDVPFEQKLEQPHQTPIISEDSTNVPHTDELQFQPLSQPRTETKSSECVAHSVVQRPLVIESEKTISHPVDVSTEADSKYSNEIVSAPSPVPSQSSSASAAPTTMQRPLVFDGSVSSLQTEVILPHGMEDNVGSNVLRQEFHDNIDRLQDDLNEDNNLPESVESSVPVDSKGKSTSFSWIPTFPKLHATSKEPKSAGQDEKEKNRKSIVETVLDGENLSDVKKDERSNVKKFFDSFKHEASQETKDKVTSSDETKIEPLPAKETSKDAKQSFKKFFTPSRPESPVVEENVSPDKPDVHEHEHKSSFAKDAKQNIKTFFDSFKHDTTDQKPKQLGQDDMVVHEAGEECVEGHKESVHGFKKFFTPSRPESPAVEGKVSPDKPEFHDQEPKSSFAKDAKQNIKTFFDSFKHETTDQKSKQLVQDDIIVPATSEEHGEGHKESMHGFKKFFSPSKSESYTVEEKKVTYDSPEAHEPEHKSSFAKDAKQNIKTFFESLKPDVVEDKSKNVQTESAIPESNKELDDVSKIQNKESKHGLKKFFDSFKHDTGEGDSSVASTKSPQPDASCTEIYKQDTEQKTDKVDSEFKEHHKDGLPNFKKMLDSFRHPEAKEHSEGQLPIESKDSAETCKAASKENVHGVKKIFDSFKHDAPPAENVDGIKSSMDSKHSEETDKKPKDSLHNIKVFFDSFKKEGPITGSEDLTVEHQKSKGLKRSQSCKESAVEKDGLRSVKSFFDSFSHKSIAKMSSHPQALNSNEEIKQNEHIYDVVEAPAVLVTSYTSNETVPKEADESKKSEKKQKDTSQSSKKLFDSFRHKDAESKPKVVEKSENIYDKVIVQPTHSEVLPSDKTKELDSKEQKDNLHGVKKFIDSFIHKDATKAIVSEPNESSKSDAVEVKIVLEPQIGEASGSSHSKPSMFTSIGENILSMKDKVLHSKDTKKSDGVVSKDSKFEEYDLESTKKSKDAEPTGGTYRVLDDLAFPQAKTVEKTEQLKTDTAENVQSIKDSKKQSVVSKPKAAELKSSKRKACPEPGTPETLYDTCCVRIATLLRDKAIEIVADKTKSPPKKPPKPSAEAIAKARAATVSRRLQEISSKGQSLGENIPVGYDGIRFADDETESSCDYKDVENFDYIMDYELINRYKFDNKLDTFSVPSTCSGMTSYYTADTVTLRDETFSDAALETISLGSNDSCHFKSLSSVHSKSEGKIASPAAPVEKLKEQKKQLSFFKFPSFRKETTKSESKPTVADKLKSPTTSQPVVKKVPPPLPPKPVLLPKPTGINSNVSKSDEKNSVSQCINGLSLSPRLQTKFAKDSAGTQRRPLMVAGVKETEFTSLQHKSKDAKNQAKDRRFDTVLKNESLKSITNMSSSHPSLVSTKSLPGEISANKSNVTSLQRKVSPQRPPPPSSSTKQEAIKSHVSLISSSPKESSETASPVTQKEKRTVSPPRPPPPVFKKTAGPPRPPPPAKPSKPPRDSASQKVEQRGKELRKHECSDPCINLKEDEHDSCPYCTKKEVLKDDSILSVPDEILHSPDSVDFSVSNEENEAVKDESLSILEDSSHKTETVEKLPILSESVPESEKPPETEKLSHGYVQNEEAAIVEIIPKPPPRIRRIRSRTVEIVPVKKESERRLRRSQSLTEIDVQKKLSVLDTHVSPESSDVKSLYTVVNKDVKKPVSNDIVNHEENSSVEKVSSRPLPAPPPPPRKFRSLDRKDRKSDKHKKEQFDNTAGEKKTMNISECDPDVKPPARKKKTENHRFHSLDSENRQGKLDPAVESTRISRSSSVPLKPERKYKHMIETRYDENANVAFPVVAEVHHRSPQLDECGNEILDSASYQNIPTTDAVDSVGRTKSKEKSASPRSPMRKNKNPKPRSHSSWYDENQPLEESWEIVDWSHRDDFESKLNVHPRVPLRRKSDPGKKTRQTSTFYVDVEQDREFLPLVDKETSPLPLECSEKSVQTSLETLSQGIASRDEQSDDTDELLDLAQTLQNELKVILNRHKSESDDESNTPPVSATDSEKNFEEKFGAIKKIPSVRSSTSELWPMSSSDESDGEIEHSGATNLTEIALMRKQKKIFYIAQEIMTSEEVFVDALRLLNVDFKAAVESANKEKNAAVIPDEVLYQILNHLPQLQHLNENLLMELKDRIENWGRIGKIADIIVKMGPFLKLYSWYIHDFESNVSLLEESKKKYPLFTQVIKDFETSSRCKRLTLNHYMLKPIQRIPQYRLLLQEYLHHLPEDSPDYQDTVAALQIVSEVANHANESMKQGDNAQKLISIQNSIIGHKEIIKPGRVFVKEGELMKLSRKGMQPRWFVLFNDLLLYLTPVQQGLYRVNHELPLTGMKVAIPIQQDYQNEFSIISVTRSFTLAARSQEERQEWIIALTKAIEENASKRSTFTNQRLQQKAQEKTSEEEEGAFVLGKKAPVWIPDARVTMCQLCTSEFTVTFRRHHCRACGKVVCSICSSNRISLPYLGNRIARVCDECHTRLGPGSSGCTESGETDSENQQLAVKPHLRTEGRHVKHRGRRNLPSVLKEVCANDQGSTISGYLQKRSGKSWKRDWFVVKDKVLYEYRASEDVAALRSIPLLGYQIELFSEAYENVEPSLLFQLTHPGQSPIIFHADTVSTTERWVAALKEASVLE